MTPVDRTCLPVPGPDRAFRFPRIARRTPANGLELRAVSHTAVPVASIVLLVPGGSSVNPASRPGLTSLTTGLLDEGSRGQSALEVADRLARIGGDLDLEVGPDATVISLATLDRCLEIGLALVNEIVTAPNLADADFDRVRQLRVERLRQLKDHASTTADRVFSRSLYSSHAYGHPRLGTEAALTATSVDDVRVLHAALFAPKGSTLVIVADRPVDVLLDAAEAAFGEWQPAPSSLPVDRRAALAPPPRQPVVRLGMVPRPGAAQSELRIGQVGTSRSTPDYHSLVVLNAILGGQFVSRLNQNLREQKGYTYGVRTSFDLRRGRGPFVVQTSVATEVTAEAIVEVLAEIRAIAGARPPTADELSLARASLCLGYPRGFETAAQVARSVAQLALHELPDSTFEDFVPRVAEVTIDDVTRVARHYLDPDGMTSVVVGDADAVAGSLGSIGLGDATVLAAEF